MLGRLIVSAACLSSGSVSLGHGEYWDSRAAQYSGGKDHREIFSESVTKIYSSLYQDYRAGLA